MKDKQGESTVKDRLVAVDASDSEEGGVDLENAEEGEG
jgi:hypothetical protein